MGNEDDNRVGANDGAECEQISEKDVDKEKAIADGRRKLLDEIFDSATRTISDVADEATDNRAIATTYVKSLMSAAHDLTTMSGDDLQRENEGFLTKLAEMFSGAVYYKRVAELATSMARAKAECEDGYGTNYDVWLSAERHIRDLLHGVVEVNRSSVERFFSGIATMFEGYTPEEHLDAVRHRALEIYEQSGRSRSTLDNWLEAEEEMRSQLRQKGRL